MLQGGVKMVISTKNENRIFVLKRVVLNLFIAVVGLILLYTLFNSFFPSQVSIKNTYFRITLMIIGIYLAVKNYYYYKNLLGVLERSDVIYKIKQNYNAKERLYYFVVFYSERIDQCKMKIDILKSLTPVPIMVFLLGILLNSDISNLGEGIEAFVDNIKNLNVSNEQVILFMVFLLMFYYLYEYRSAWMTYKDALKGYFAYKYEHDIYQGESRENDTRISL